MGVGAVSLLKLFVRFPMVPRSLSQFEVIYPQYNSIFVNIIIIIECENKEDGKNVTYISKRLNEKKSIAYTVENY